MEVRGKNVKLCIVIYKQLPRMSFWSSSKVKHWEPVDTGSLPSFYVTMYDETGNFEGKGGDFIMGSFLDDLVVTN